MSEVVRQDSTALRNIAQTIETTAEEFKHEKEMLFEKMQNEIGNDPGHVAWYGPQAEVFIQNFNAKEQDFVNAYNNMISIANNLREQANSWDRFEQGN